MAVTMQQVRSVLDPEETDYERGRSLGPEALPHLEALVKSAHPMLASKAAYLAGLLAEPGSASVVAQAAASDEPTVRVAAAAAARHLAESSVEAVLIPLLSDSDPGVRRVALGSVPQAAARSLRSKIEDLVSTETDDVVRALSSQVLSRLSSEPATPRTGTGTGTGILGKKGNSPVAESKGEMPGQKAAGEMTGQSSATGEMPGVKSNDAKMTPSAEMPGPSSGGREGEMPALTPSKRSDEMPPMAQAGDAMPKALRSSGEMSGSPSPQGEMPRARTGTGTGTGEMPG